MAIFWAWLMLLGKCWLCYHLAIEPGLIAKVYAGSQCLVLLGTAYVLMVGRVDRSIGGALVPLLHGFSYLYDFGNPVGFADAFAVYYLLLPLQWLLRLRMGVRCTVTAPVWHSLLSGFPYSMVRHPLAAVEIGLLTSVFVGLGGWHNFAVWFLSVAGAVVVTGIEERFLRTLPEYQDYAKRVPWRFVPGIC